MVLSRPPPKFSCTIRFNYAHLRQLNKRTITQNDFGDVIQTAYSGLMKTQQQYKRDFDRRIKKIQRNIREGDYVYIDPTDGIDR